MHVFSKKSIRNGITFYQEKKEVWLIEGYSMNRQSDEYRKCNKGL